MARSDESEPTGPWRTIRKTLESRGVRIALAVTIIVSLLPYKSLEDQLRPLLLLVFGLEFSLRVALLVKRQVARPRTEMGFLLVDFVALLSFLPHTWLGVPTSLLRVLRLARLIVLLRFTRELARDVYQVITRREQLRQLAFVSAAVLGLSFVAAVLLHGLGWPEDVGEDGFWDQMWWAFRQVESPDNLVPTIREHPGIVVVSLGLTIVGIFVFSYLIGLGTTIVEQVLAAEKRRPVAYEGHTLIAGPVHECEAMVEEFVRIYEKNRDLRRIRPGEIWRWLKGQDPRPRRHALPKITLLGPNDELPGFLYESHMRWVVYRQGFAADREAIVRAGGSDAKRAVFLPQGVGDDADARTIAGLSTFRYSNSKAHVFVEMRRSANVSVAQSVGGPGTFVLDGPRFVGLFLAHHLTLPGAERVFAELMSADGNEMYTHLYADEGEHAALAALGDTPLSFRAMARHAHEEHGVTLVGAFLAEDHAVRQGSSLLSVTELTPWVNPLHLPEGAGPTGDAHETVGEGRAADARDAASASDAAAGTSDAADESGAGTGDVSGIADEGGSAVDGDAAGAGDAARKSDAAGATHDEGGSAVDGDADRAADAARKSDAAGATRDAADSKLLSLVHEADAIPARSLQGVFGLAPTYLPLRRAARSLTRMPEAPALDSSGADAASALFGASRLAQGPSKVLIVGGNGSLRHLVDALANFVAGIGIHVLLPAGARVEPFAESLEGGGTCRVLHSPKFAVDAARCAIDHAIDAVVFMANRLEQGHQKRDTDADTALQVHRFVAELGERASENLQLLVEVEEPERGLALQRDVHRLTGGRVSLIPVSTSEITNYFLVHSVFVPGVMGLYEQLLGSKGEDLVYLPARKSGAGGDVSVRALRDHLMDRGFVFLGLRFTDGEVVLNPAPGAVYEGAMIHGAVVVADTATPR